MPSVPRRPRFSAAAIVVAVLCVAIAIGVAFGIRRSLGSASAAASALPTSQAMLIAQGTEIGEHVFNDGDTSSGGNGQTVDGIACNLQEMLAKHDHAHLSLIFHGVQAALPRYIGIVLRPGGQGCIYWLHTHDATGIIHIESPEVNGAYTLGQFFDIWGRKLTPADVAGHSGALHAFVDGMAYRGDPRAIPLAPHAEITLEVGKPVVPPPAYVFPPGL